MDAKQMKKWESAFYQSLKAATKARKVKLSAEHDIYKKEGPYFYNVFYWVVRVEDGKADIELSISLKYHRFDELQLGIVNPGPFHFTDKVRANSGALCASPIACVTQSFAHDGGEGSLPGLCEDLLDFLEGFYSDFLDKVKEEYGDLNGYYIANKEDMPRLAGLAYLDRGEPDEAIECFSSPQMDGENNLWSVEIHTDEQYRRARESGADIFEGEYGRRLHRSRKEQFVDYATALGNGLEWNFDRAMYGLLDEER